jgi:hypothetical protein
MLGAEEKEEEWGKAWNDVKQRELDPRLVREARKTEVEYILKRKLYNNVPRSKCYEKTSKAPIEWFVEKQYNVEHDNELFAATPPLEALRMLLSHTATTGHGGSPTQRLLLCDVSTREETRRR